MDIDIDFLSDSLLKCPTQKIKPEPDIYVLDNMWRSMPVRWRVPACVRSDWADAVQLNVTRHTGRPQSSRTTCLLTGTVHPPVSAAATSSSPSSSIVIVITSKSPSPWSPSSTAAIIYKSSVVVWLHGNTLVLINEVVLCHAWLVPFWWLQRGHGTVCHQRLGPAPHFDIPKGDQFSPFSSVIRPTSCSPFTFTAYRTALTYTDESSGLQDRTNLHWPLHSHHQPMSLLSCATVLDIDFVKCLATVWWQHYNPNIFSSSSSSSSSTKTGNCQGQVNHLDAEPASQIYSAWPSLHE